MNRQSPLRRLMLLPYQLFAIIGFTALTLFWGLASCVASLFDPTGDRAHRCLIYWAKTNLSLAGIRVNVEGRERLDPDGTYIFMANHSSFLDIILVFAYVPYNFRIVTKVEMFDLPLIGWALKRSRQIPIDRAHPRKGLASLDQAGELLQKRISVVVFPEGTRSLDGEVKDFKPTLFVLPIRSGIAVAPIRIEGTFDALKKGSFLINPVSLSMNFYEPVAAESFSDETRWLYAKKLQDLLSPLPPLKRGEPQPF